MRHHFKRGQGWGRLLIAEYRETGGLLNRDVVHKRFIEHLPKRLRRIEQNVDVARADLAPRYEDARAFIVCGAIAAWAGQWWEVVRPTPGKWDILAGKPVLNVLVGMAGATPAAFLVQVDHVSGRVTSRQVPTDLRLKPGTGPATSLAEAVGIHESSMSINDLQQAASAALDVERLDCLIAHDQLLRALAPGLLEDADRSPNIKVWSPLEAWLTALQSIRFGQLKTTLGPWQLLRLVSTVRSAGAARSK
jgi:hypothetical protein